jgi:hypothetical protein
MAAKTLTLGSDVCFDVHVNVRSGIAKRTMDVAGCVCVDGVDRYQAAKRDIPYDNAKTLDENYAVAVAALKAQEDVA